MPTTHTSAPAPATAHAAALPPQRPTPHSAGAPVSTTDAPASHHPRILAIDPGPTISGYVVVDEVGIRGDVRPTQEVADILGLRMTKAPDVIAIERISPMGQRIGEETIATCIWCGELAQLARDRYPTARVVLVPRAVVKRHLLGRSNAPGADAALRQVIVDRFGGVGGKAAAVGVKASPGPLFGLRSHCWQALALALTVQDGAA